MHSLLNVSNLTITFGMQKVIDNVSFSLFEGQYLAVIGPNGSGKSTLVKAITKEIKRYHGSISIDRHVTCGYMSQQNQEGKSGPKGQPRGGPDGRNGKDSVTVAGSEAGTEE